MADYFSNYGGGQRRRGNSGGQQDQPQTPAATPGPTPGGSRRPGGLEGMRMPSAIRIRRLPPGIVGTPRPQTQEGAQTTAVQDHASGRRRSTSEPQRHYGQNLAPPDANLTRQRTQENLPTVGEEGGARTPRSEVATPYHDATEAFPDYDSGTAAPADRVTSSASTMHGAGNAARRNRGLSRMTSGTSSTGRERVAPGEYESDVVDLLDLVDPEVRTLGTLTNVQNSLFVPDLGRWLNRRPTYNLTSRQSSGPVQPPSRPRAGTGAAKPPPSDLPTIPQAQEQPSETAETQDGIEMQRPAGTRRLSISSNLSDSRYAVLPHGISLEGWSEEDKADLDDYVRHLMHSKREGFKRGMRGFFQYISHPLGLFVFAYATLITLFGAAWVFFLIGWIYVGSRQQYIIDIIDNVLVAFFALMGDGLAPFRAIDTYHMCFIARYYHLTWRLRKERNLPDLVDHNDLPMQRQSAADVEDQIDKEETAEYSVLKPIQQRRLQYHQAKFSKQHTFYRPHETPTHHAFPLNLLVAIVVLLDFHSFFQIALGTTTWSWNYRHRPEWLTSTILGCSLSCNITAGILISVGDHRTRKKDVLERIERQNLTQEALERMADERNEPQLAKKSVEVSRAISEQEKAREQQSEAGPALLVQSPTAEEEQEKKDL